MEHESVKLDILTPDIVMVILTWITFFALLFILKKFAWKPILDGLQQREDYIRKSLEDADKAKAELAKIEAIKTQMLNEAKIQGAQIIDDARKSSRELGHDIEVKAKQNAHDIMQNAAIQIEGERQRVREALKKESAQIAIGLAGKILKENVDTDKNRRLVNEAVGTL